MKFVLVDKYDNIVASVNLESEVGVSGAKTYFKGMKKMPNDKDFDKLWRVMTDEQYDLEFKATLQNRQLDQRKYEWWKDEETYLDVDAPPSNSGEDNGRETKGAKKKRRLPYHTTKKRIGTTSTRNRG